MTPTLRHRLYPAIEPYETGRLEVSDRHTLHYERSGRRGGVPAVVLHGGPGGGSNPNLRRYFRPDHYDVLIFDQRGCGASTPHACVEDNDTWALVRDIEALRRHVGVERWLVFGGSWGSTLALAYAQSHPDRVDALVLRGIFTGAREELDWFYRSGAPQILPEAYATFAGFIPPQERDDLLDAYHRRIHGPDRELALEAARHWARWETTASCLSIDPDKAAASENPHHALAISAIETHYFVHGCFFDAITHPFAPGRIAALRDTPIVIAHGRYDLITPAATAWRLKRLVPHADLHFAPHAGHAASEEELIDLLVAATDRAAGR